MLQAEVLCVVFVVVEERTDVFGSSKVRWSTASSRNTSKNLNQLK